MRGLILFMSVLLIAGTAFAGRGGPDDFGYIWVDSDEPGGPTFNWVDITTRGTYLYLGDDDNEPVPMPITFDFYGNIFGDTLYVCSNGWCSFTSTATSLTNYSLPSTSGPENLLAVFWDDFDPADRGEIYYFGNSDSMIVSYVGVGHYGYPEPLGYYTYQVILTTDGVVHYQYDTIDTTGGAPLNSCTIGIQNGDKTIGLQVVYNDFYVHDQLAVDLKIAPLAMNCHNYSPLMCHGRNRFQFALEFDNRTGDAIPLELIFAAHEGSNCTEEPFKLLRRDQTVPPGVSMGYFWVKVHKTVMPGDYSASVSFTYNEELIACCMNTTIIECGPFRGNEDNNWEWVEVDRLDAALPTTTELHQNYPNPFNANTNISYSLAEASNVSLSVYDISGRLVATLVNGQQEAGEHVATWDASQVSSGVYFYKLTTADYTSTKKMNLLK
jgi:hypothetical protein